MMENNNNLTVFNNEQFGDLRITKINGVDTFNLSDVCFCLGYTKKNSDGKLHLRKDKIENICETLDIKGVSLSDTKYIITKTIDFENTYINEEDFYDFCLESKAKHARIFRKWVTTEVLPSIRQNGGYIKDGASEIQVDKLTKYSLPKLKYTFKTENIEQIHTMYQDVKEFYRYKVRDTDFRIKVMKNIEQGLKDRIDIYSGDSKHIALITICDDLIKIIKEDRDELRARISGGKMSQKTRVINNQVKMINEKNEELFKLENKISSMCPSIDDYMCIPVHGLSNNSLYETVKNDYTGKDITVKTYQYKKWLQEFPNDCLIPKEELNVDWDKPIMLLYKFDCKKAFDVNNLEKSATDTILTKFYGENDNIVDKTVIERNKDVEEYRDGKIYICIKNVE